MLSYDEALDRILQQIEALAATRLPIQKSAGLVLAENVIAPAPIPTFRNSAMDGYAIQYHDWHSRQSDGSASFRIVDVIRAGDPPTRPVRRGEAAQINTGAMMPDDADAVAPVEDCDVDGDQLIVRGDVVRGRHIRLAGSDVSAGTVVAHGGQQIGPGAIGMLAAVGRSTVKVHRRPRIAILTTGDELVTPGVALQPGQIYNSNGYAIAAQVTEAGGTIVKQLHATDTRDSLRAALDACAVCDLLITTGGVSMGEFDYVKDVFSERGLVDFWQVAIRPGKPLAFGRWRDTFFFGLPGNPVSSMVTFELFVRPAIRKMLGNSTVNRPVVTAKLTSDVSHEPGRRSFLRVCVSQKEGEFVAALAGGQASNMQHAMVSANGLLIVPESMERIEVGATGQVIIIGGLN